jgi:hypothetical protein
MPADRRCSGERCYSRAIPDLQAPMMVVSYRLDIVRCTQPNRSQFLLRIEYSRLSVRRSRRSPTIAGVACAISSSGLT